MVLLSSLLGFLCGYTGYRPLADFYRQHHREIRTLLALPESQSMPSYSTFRRCFLEIPPTVWIDAFNIWAVTTLTDLPASLWSIDGKSIRCTSTGGNGKNQNFVSLVSIYSHSFGVLQQKMMENKKCSEIHVAHALLAQLPELPPGQCFSLDALHTTHATVNAVNHIQQDYLLGLKQNRVTTYDHVETLTQTQCPQDVASDQDNAHGRRILRQVHVFEPTSYLTTKYPHLKTVGRVQQSGVRGKKPFSETVYYLSSRAWSALELLQVTRQHWQIANGLHWVKDVLFKEDNPVRRGGHAPVNWAILHMFGITLARRQGFRTVPQAFRSWANRLNEVFHFFV